MPPGSQVYSRDTVLSTLSSRAFLRRVGRQRAGYLKPLLSLLLQNRPPKIRVDSIRPWWSLPERRPDPYNSLLGLLVAPRNATEAEPAKEGRLDRAVMPKNLQEARKTCVKIGRLYRMVRIAAVLPSNPAPRRSAGRPRWGPAARFAVSLRTGRRLRPSASAGPRDLDRPGTRRPVPAHPGRSRPRASGPPGVSPGRAASMSQTLSPITMESVIDTSSRSAVATNEIRIGLGMFHLIASDGGYCRVQSESLERRAGTLEPSTRRDGPRHPGPCQVEPASSRLRGRTHTSIDAAYGPTRFQCRLGNSADRNDWRLGPDSRRVRSIDLPIGANTA